MEVVWLHSLEPLGLECPYPSPSEGAQYHPWPSEPNRQAIRSNKALLLKDMFLYVYIQKYKP